MPDNEKNCGNCIWNEDLLCDRNGKIVKDTDRACRQWEGDVKTERIPSKRKNAE